MVYVDSVGVLGIGGKLNNGMTYIVSSNLDGVSSTKNELANVGTGFDYWIGGTADNDRIFIVSGEISAAEDFDSDSVTQIKQLDLQGVTSLNSAKIRKWQTLGQIQAFSLKTTVILQNNILYIEGNYLQGLAAFDLNDGSSELFPDIFVTEGQGFLSSPARYYFNDKLYFIGGQGSRRSKNGVPNCWVQSVDISVYPPVQNCESTMRDLYSVKFSYLNMIP